MREKDSLAAFLQNFQNSRRNFIDPRRVCNATIFDRNVDINARQDSLPGEVHIVESLEAAHIYLSLKKLRHNERSIAHACRKAPFIIIPA